MNVPSQEISASSTGSADSLPTQTSQQYSGERIDVEVHFLPRCRVEMKVTTNKPLVGEAYRNALKKVGKELAIPGFRKGHAPAELVAKRFAPELDKQWQEEIAKIAATEAQKLAKVPMLAREPRITFKTEQHSHDGAKLTLFFETEPQVPIVDPKKLQLKEVKRPEVNDEKIDETMRQTQLFFAEWHPVEGRLIQEGDFIRLDVTITEEQPPEELFTNTRFEVVRRSMAAWMYDLVVGQTAGAVIEGTSQPDPDENGQDENGPDENGPDENGQEEADADKQELTPKKVELRIIAVETPTYPPLDDSFARQLGASSVAEMRQRITDLLERQADEHVREKQREQLTEQLLTHYSFDLPETLVEREAHFRMKQLFQDVDFLAAWKDMNAEKQRSLYRRVAEQSEKAVRMFYLCKQVMQEARLGISPNELHGGGTSPLEALVRPTDEVQLHDHGEVRQAEAFSRLVLEKAQDYLIHQALGK